MPTMWIGIGYILKPFPVLPSYTEIQKLWLRHNAYL